ncbi:MAG: methyltransferase domain-containing protein [Patescibacteria group bacterium]|jgi:SAM-dependent methyltransferase
MDWGTIIFIAVYILLVTSALAGLSAAPWIPTRKKERDALVGLLSLQPGDTVYDLGCGDGGVLFDLAARFPEAKFIGFEISLLPYALAQLRRLFAGRRGANVRILLRDLYGQDLSDATVIFIFLMPKVYDRLKKKFAAELQPEAMVITEVWPFEGIEPVRLVKEPGRVQLRVYQGRQFRG